MAYLFSHLVGSWLVGLLIQHFTKEKLKRVSWGLLLLGGILPDADFLFDWFLGTAIHRTVTHSIFFIIAIFLIVYFILKRYNLQSKAYFIGIGIVTHIILDVVFTPGIMLFWPFTYYVSVAGAVNPIIDNLAYNIPFYVWDMGIGAVWLGYLFIRNKMNF